MLVCYDRDWLEKKRIGLPLAPILYWQAKQEAWATVSCICLSHTEETDELSLLLQCLRCFFSLILLWFRSVYTLLSIWEQDSMLTHLRLIVYACQLLNVRKLAILSFTISIFPLAHQNCFLPQGQATQASCGVSQMNTLGRDSYHYSVTDLDKTDLWLHILISLLLYYWDFFYMLKHSSTKNNSATSLGYLNIKDIK